MNVFRFVPIVLATVVLYASAQNTNHNESAESNYLSSLSTVMITGAASHLGSFLAIALAEMFPNITLILLDQLEAQNLFKIKQGPSLESQFEPPASQTMNQKQLEESLARFEIKRQRITYVLSHVDNAHFYRVDYRPSLKQFHSPDRFDVLEKMFNDFNITHVVHLEDNLLNPNVSQAVPRRCNDDRMGYFDGILHQINLEKKKGKHVPSLVFGSTSEIYNPNSIQDGIGREDWNVTYPSSIKGMEKLTMERLAKLFSDVHGIFSIGLRFFDVYGPFGDVTKDDPLSNLIRDYHQILSSNTNQVHMNRSNFDIYKRKRDYIFVDDAIDAIISAMQVHEHHFSSNSCQIINVGTGQARSLSDALVAIDRMIANNVIGLVSDEEPSQRNVIASMTKVRTVLGFHPIISLEEGVERTIRWYSERMILPSNLRMKTSKCSPLDKGCVIDHVIFPCASEWAEDERCTPSVYDNARKISLYLTKECDVVQYKIELLKHLERIPHVSSDSKRENCNPNGQEEKEHCCIAFVREDSTLVSRLKVEQGIQSDISIQDLMLSEMSSLSTQNSRTVLKQGVWALIPFNIPSNDERDLIFTVNLPQFSPASFFKSKYAIYVSETVSALNSWELIEQFEENSSSNEIMLMLIATTMSNNITSYDENGVSSIQQQNLYRSIGVVIRNIIHSSPDSLFASYSVHRLQSHNAKRLRREVYGEMLRWKGNHVHEVNCFVLALQNFWFHYLMSSPEAKKDESIYSILATNNDLRHFVKIIPYS